ncbi:MAG: 1-deoxy-D-xylulose-5-phosphate synthase N-terminal domain-containing protein, partial [Elusimicrobiota bacterium]
MKILSNINSPSDLRKLKPEQLPQVCSELRQTILETICKTGGHLGSSLGATEIITALHYVYKTPRDKIVFDTGHQSYSHKILTGRRDKFPSIRQMGGLSGFPKRTESDYD